MQYRTIWHCDYLELSSIHIHIVFTPNLIFLFHEYFQWRGFSGVHHFFLNPEIRLKPSSVNIKFLYWFTLDFHYWCTPYFDVHQRILYKKVYKRSTTRNLRIFFNVIHVYFNFVRFMVYMKEICCFKVILHYRQNL